MSMARGSGSARDSSPDYRAELHAIDQLSPRTYVGGDTFSGGHTFRIRSQE